MLDSTSARRQLDLAWVDPQDPGGRRLRVEVDHQHTMPGGSCGRRQAERDGGLADAALLVQQGDRVLVVGRAMRCIVSGLTGHDRRAGRNPLDDGRRRSAGSLAASTRHRGVERHVLAHGQDDQMVRRAGTPARDRHRGRASSNVAADQIGCARAAGAAAFGTGAGSRWGRRASSPRCASRVSGANGSHGSTGQPWSPSAVHGIGARQPSRPPGSTTRSRRHLGIDQPQALALVEERGAGQREQQHGHHPREALVAAVATAVARDVVVRQHPGGPGTDRREVTERGGDALAAARRRWVRPTGSGS